MNTVGPQARAALQKLHENLASMERVARVLIIDDNQLDCDLLEKGIRRHRPNVLLDVAHTQPEADRLCAHYCYDVIFLDLLLPGRSGVDLMKSSPCFEQGEGHLIVLTGLEDNSDLVKQAIDSGAKVIFRKPMSDRQFDLIFGRIP